MTPEFNTAFNNQATEHLEKATQGVMKAYEGINDLAREHMDATVKSVSAMSTGIEEIARNTSGLMQESFERSVNAGKTMMGAKNLREAADLQSEFMKECFDCWVAGTGKISEISARMTQNVMAPIAEHASSAIHKITQKARAA